MNSTVQNIKMNFTISNIFLRIFEQEPIWQQAARNSLKEKQGLSYVAENTLTSCF